MQESFLHYLWKYSLFSTPLMLTNGSQVEVLNVGNHNNDSGPDFFNAKIKINETIWVGNVEMHVNTSDWFKHKHDKDDAYDSIILHVVAENDIQVNRKNGEHIPTIVLTCAKGVYEQYLFLMQNKAWVPCENFITKVDYFTVFGWKESLLIERLETKAMVIERRWHSCNKNFEETFYQTLAANFGFKTNAVPFEMLAKQLPQKYLLKHKDNISSIEAMLFGVAGLLPEQSNDAYVNDLKREFKHMQNKFQLKTLNKHIWKNSKLRPSNFPTIRIAQFASLFFNINSLDSKILESDKVEDAKNLFDVHASEYWDKHYSFHKLALKKVKRIGEVAFNNIVINTIAPYFVFYAKQKNNIGYTEKAIKWLMDVSAENNHIVRHWKELGLKVENAFDSQSLIQLKNIYCNKRNCLNCRIGNQVIQHKF